MFSFKEDRAMTIEMAEQTEVGAWIDGLGHAFCNECAAVEGRCKGHGTWVEAHSVGTLEGDGEARCDACERTLRACTPRVYSGTVVVEHMKCKIF
jgi:hypothetical protein